ncbi:hypothetical protein N5C46_22990 [Rossellomorea vietnamensis]|uniref:Uncharacterized protein n=1 Tax=Rossellomorea vietnamensis TaxID=218284 RepID=A0ACD4C7P3_9BACI|nr:hypothetical protein [Rossellomorea vietnamensis]UXH44446.1 hypothetical protein N5C46_22990 [Rossellomorea vietnamensis]
MDIPSEFSKVISNEVKKINLYSLPQYTWLVLLYYLSINAIWNWVQVIDSKVDIMPKQVIDLNNIIFITLKTWVPFVLFLGIAFLISGICLGVIKFLPFLEDERFSWHGAYGIVIGMWLVIICLSFQTYLNFPIMFPFIIPMLYIVIDLIRKKVGKALYY